MKVKELKNIKKVRFNDFSGYDPEKCNNGGGYGFWTDYTRVDNGWEVSYGTTADLEYCPCCGSFGNHYDYEEYTCRDFEVITEEELLKRINEFQETEDCYIEIQNQ